MIDMSIGDLPVTGVIACISLLFELKKNISHCVSSSFVSRDLRLALVYNEDAEFGSVTPHLSADSKLLENQPNPILKLDMAKFVVLHLVLCIFVSI